MSQKGKIYCFVPSCKNTSENAPSKIFLTVPSQPNIRKEWFKQIDHEGTFSLKSSYRCCEDHFCLEEDLENYLEIKTMREMGMSCKIKLKPNAVPHIFDCQPDRDQCNTELGVPPAKKPKTSLVLQDILENEHSFERKEYLTALPSKFSESDESDDELLFTSAGSVGGNEANVDKFLSVVVDEEVDQWPETSQPSINVRSLSPCAFCGCCCRTTGPKQNGDGEIQVDAEQKKFKDKLVQVKLRPKYRSKMVQTESQSPKLDNIKKNKLDAPNLVQSQDASPVQSRVDSPIQEQMEMDFPIQGPSNADAPAQTQSETEVLTKSSLDVSRHESDRGSTFTTDSNLDAANTSSEIVTNSWKELHSTTALVPIIVDLMKKKPKLYLGIDPDYLWAIPFFANWTGISEIGIMITLRKIRLNECYEILADNFCKSVSKISRIFNDTLPLLARCFEKISFRPDREIIHVPNSFVPHYAKVTFIIDCFEVRIQKPSDSLKQSLTWSQYKKANTCKFLISASPDGLIRFISEGFGGRATDVQVVENSGFFGILPSSSTVMAVRGFKQLSELFSRMGHNLIRPPSVEKDKKMAQQKARETTKTARLRFQIERVVKRCRDFAMLAPHACFHHDLLHVIDYIVVIVCGICNLHRPLTL